MRNILVLGVLWATMPFCRAERVPGRYIVELDGAPVVTRMARQARVGRMALRSASAETHRAQIRTEQAALRGRLESRQVKVLDSIDTVANALFVEVPDAEAAALRSLAGVKRVVQERTFHRVMDRAVGLTKASEAWALVGREHAGEGVKIAIIDSGVDQTHPSLDDPTMAAPEGFPRSNYASDVNNTNGKVIVARSYVALLRNRDADYSARDHVGHGTALASVAAGIPSDGTYATVMGIAPRAWIGSYKVFGTPGYNDSATDAAILKAIDDAVADGMDIINLSLGDDFAPRLADDLDVDAVERATQAGVIVTVSAGNNGPGLNTISSPATAPSAVTVGATSNDRTLFYSVEVEGTGWYLACPGDGPEPAGPISGELADIEALDGNGLGCGAAEAGTLTGKIVLIRRGSCTFESKINNAARGGAAGVIIHAAEDSPQPIWMSVVTAALPAEMVSWESGMSIKQRIATGEATRATMRFTVGAVPQTANRVTDFSAAGPSVDLGMKPDLVATGGDVYVATQRLNPNSSMYSPDRYTLVDGTSFSSPMVAGAAAVVKAARPGLTVDQYRSMLVNSASPAVTSLSSETALLTQTGAGLLDVKAAIESTAAAAPVSLSFGAGGLTLESSRTLTISNTGASAETFTIGVAQRRGESAPVVEPASLELEPGASAEVKVNWTAPALTAGPQEGYITVDGTVSGKSMRVPYWYAATEMKPSQITILSAVASARRGTTQTDAVYFRVLDASGVPLTDVTPEISVVSGGGEVGPVTNYDTDVPGVFGATVRLGLVAGANVYRIQAGDAVYTVTITGQ